MANLDREFDLTDKRVTQLTVAEPFATPLNYTSVSTMRARLAAINAGYYTTARLEQMTKNDMTYALRTLDDAAGI